MACTDSSSSSWLWVRLPLRRAGPWGRRQRRPDRHLRGDAAVLCHRSHQGPDDNLAGVVDPSPHPPLDPVGLHHRRDIYSPPGVALRPSSNPRGRMDRRGVEPDHGGRRVGIPTPPTRTNPRRRVNASDPPTREGTPLRDRPTGSGPAPDPPSRERRRHCWVDLTDHPTFSSEAEAEGMVLQWAQDERGWVALVVFVITRPGADLTVQEWVPRSRLRPAR